MLNSKTDEVLNDLIAHLGWCLVQYEKEEEPRQSPNPGELPSRPHVNWSPLDTLKKNLLDFRGYPDSDQASAVAEFLVFVLDRVFSDLCTDTPWDKRGLINVAWGQTQEAILKLLKNYKDALEEANEETDKKLWESFREFSKKYNRILERINKEDVADMKGI
jgi:hypothetical protein